MAQSQMELPPTFETEVSENYGEAPESLKEITRGLLNGTIPRHDEIPPSAQYNMKENY